MNKSLGFIVSMVIFAIGVFAVIASMIIGGVDELTWPVAICQSITILCMVGLLAIKLAKTEEAEEKHTGYAERDDVFYGNDEEDEPASYDAEDYAVPEEPVYTKKASYPTQEIEVEPEQEPEEKPAHKAVFDDEIEDKYEEVPSFEPVTEEVAEEEDEFEEKNHVTKGALFEIEKFEPEITQPEEEPEFEETVSFESEETELINEEPEEAVISQDEPVAPVKEDFIERMEPSFKVKSEAVNQFEEEDELSLDMDSIIEQVFLPEAEEVTYNEPRVRMRLRVIGVRRVRTQTPRPRRLFLRK